MALTLAITGGTGFVGKHVLAKAVAGGHRVQALTRKPQPPQARIQWITGTLETPAVLQALVKGADAVVHIAGVTNAKSRADFDIGNVGGTAAMRAAAGALPFVHVSSLAAREPALSLYGASKRQAEDVARGVTGPWVMLRPPAVYGPGDTELLALFRATKLGIVPVPAGARAAMLFVGDLADALVALAQDIAGNRRSAGVIYEIDDGTGGYWQDQIARSAATAMARAVRVLPVPNAALALAAAIDTTVSRLRGKLPTLSFDRASYLAHKDWTADSMPLIASGIWRPQTVLPEGMAQTVDWYRKAGWL